MRKTFIPIHERHIINLARANGKQPQARYYFLN